MTIIDELLILLDDLEETSADDIPPYFPETNLQVIFSSLGRLVNRGWVVKKNRKGEILYGISSHGITELNATLDAIKDESTKIWDNAWYMVIFDIPENKRKLRDNLRIVLKDSGFGMLTSSVWLTPWNQKETIKKFCKRNNLNDNIFQLTTHPETDSYQSTILAHRCWDWQKIENSYRQFLTVATKGLKQLSHNDPSSRFEAKKLVFRYAEVVKQDPQLPLQLAPNATWIRKASELYRKVRPFCLTSNQS